MTEFYKHFWLDENNKPFLIAGNPAEKFKDALDAYVQEAGLFPYLHTIIWDDRNGTCRTLDIEEEFIEREREEEIEAEEDQQNKAYWNWAQAHGGPYG